MKKFLLAFFISLSIILASSIAIAQSPTRPPLSPETLSDITVVDSEWVKENYQKMEVHSVRNKAEYAEGHIPGTIWSIYTEESKWSTDFDPSKDKFDTSKLPADKNTPIIVYGNDEYWWRPYKASVMLLKAGYKEVYWYRKGISDWLLKDYPVD